MESRFIKNIKLASIPVTMGISIILMSILYPCQGERTKTKLVSLNTINTRIQDSHQQNASITVTEWGKAKNGQLVNLLTLIYRHTTTHKFYIKQDNLQSILEKDTQVERIAINLKFTEGPLWHQDGFLLFSDIPANTIYQWQPHQKLQIFRSPSGNANGNTFDLQGRLITAEHANRRISRTEKNGKLVTLVSHYRGKRLNSPNDLVVKSDGSIYFTDPPYGIKPQQKELGFYGVYCLTSDGKLTLLAKDFVRPNGITFSPDETKLYVNDSEAGYIRVFDVNSDGLLKNARIFAQQKYPGKEGVPDGMKVDIKGNVYSTGPGGVWVFSPVGNLLGIIEVPEVPANLAWGDNDYKTLYITARNSLYRIRLKNPGVRPGKSFAQRI
ncbi:MULTISPECIES: SMP-30/gluconolactonase/LRE family protein [unclassified Nostoc]|uniref:SMP-30/gluconolactonase/LRE family protein n=1 Tax=unclassified Nostoc TaxID=2593658 RepID=UPI002AD1D28B|nr:MULTISPECIES: SMP-30/gluconolactonase/LRE family protein [unclassified Nostoc]MDZ8124677.1 SMP-30/gluconolactonase/LRE family protein [Nostoc sp. CmiVER01]MDZ8223304.1 SMP-30/gluconolactonase/LRE family protein [Nostoc sp. ChiVER01]